MTFIELIKAISRGVMKAVNAKLATKADSSTVATLESTVSAQSTAIGQKADLSEVNTLLAAKAGSDDVAAVTAALADKADTAYVQSALAGKATTVELQGLAAYTDNQLNTKANAQYVDDKVAQFTSNILDITNSVAANQTAIDTLQVASATKAEVSALESQVLAITNLADADLDSLREIADRINSDADLVTVEVANRTAADTALQNQINGLTAAVNHFVLSGTTLDGLTGQALVDAIEALAQSEANTAA